MRHKSKKRKRGSQTHGHGSCKKRRGAGNRGGRGKAGSGKRGNAKLMKITGGSKKYLGKHGFVPPNQKNVKEINIEHIQEKLGTWINKGSVNKKGDIFIINLTELGYDKLLSKGTVKNKFEIKVNSASENVVSKIEKAGGKVELNVDKKE